MTEAVMSTNRQRKSVEGYSKFLIQLGWTVEIIAVVIGLAISVVVSYSAYKSFPHEKNAVNLLEGYFAMSVASLPFVLVAVAELCKIPLTYAFMCVRNIVWRLLFLFFVFFLCLITFETMFNGFERNFSNLNRAIDWRKSEIESLDSQIALLTRQKGYTQEFTEDELLKEVSQSKETINDSYSQKISLLNNKTAQLMSGLNGVNKEEINAEIERLMNVRDTYYESWKAEKHAVEDRFSALLLENISGSQNERERLLAELEALKREMAQALEDSNFFTRDSVESKYRALIREKNEQLSRITTGYLGGEALEKQSKMEAELKQQLEFVNKKYVGRIEDLNQRIDHLRKEIVDQQRKHEELKQTIISRDEAERLRLLEVKANEEKKLNQYETQKTSELETMTSNVRSLNRKIFRLQNQRRKYATEISHLINQNQVYRLAMYAFGTTSASEVDRSMVGVVAFLWFGSLSLITAVTGVMLALAGFYLRRLREEESPSDTDTNTNRDTNPNTSTDTNPDTKHFDQVYMRRIRETDPDSGTNPVTEDVDQESQRASSPSSQFGPEEPQRERNLKESDSDTESTDSQTDRK